MTAFGQPVPSSGRPFTPHAIEGRGYAVPFVRFISTNAAARGGLMVWSRHPHAANVWIGDAMNDEIEAPVPSRQTPCKRRPPKPHADTVTRCPGRTGAISKLP